MKTVILDGITVNPGDLQWTPFQGLGEVEIYPDTTPEEVVGHIGDAQAVVVNRVSLTKSQMAQCPNLRYIGVFATGYNLIDVKGARELGISVANVPAYSTNAVAQSVFAYLLYLANNVAGHDAMVKKGAWERPGGFDYSYTKTFELAGKTLGLVGMGNIGYQTAQIAQAFGMKVLAWRRHPVPDWETPSLRFAPLDQVLSQSQIISLHVPLNQETHHLIDRAAIEKMQTGVILINTARGGVLDQEAVVEGLDSGKIQYACIDVLEVEPPQPHNPLIHHPCCIATPHVAWACRETRQRVVQIAAENVAAFFQGKPVNIVN